MSKRTHTLEKLLQEIQALQPSAVVIIDQIIQCAFLSKASDIHIQPSKDALRVRIRLDGLLTDLCLIPYSVYNEVLTRVKILSNLRTDEHTTPQDGRFTVNYADFPELYIRTSIIPTHHGENVVLRLLVAYTNLNSLGDLGFLEEQQRKIKYALAKDAGLIVITGPTGSGKSSTLYTLLNSLNKNEKSIVTIEDPVEYSIHGTTQIPVRTIGFTFVDALRSVLRQDPDIIGLGEIRDAESANLAIQAALTGHLVITTLHTNNAKGTVSRLLSMGIDPYLISSTLLLIIHQKLTTRLCPTCRKRASLMKEQKEFFAKQILQDYLRPRVRFVAPGCESCNFTGVLGRTLVSELLTFYEKSELEMHTLNSLREKLQTASTQPIWLDSIQKATTGEIPLEACIPFFT